MTSDVRCQVHGPAVVDIEDEQLLVTSDPWDRPTAETVASLLTALPAYAAAWTWTSIGVRCPAGPRGVEVAA